MKDSQFGFSYSWKDLQPVRALVVTILVFQVIGALLAASQHNDMKLFNTLWLGAAYATFPGFIIGYIIQANTNKEAISKNKTMVQRIGMLALFFTVIAFVLPPI